MPLPETPSDPSNGHDRPSAGQAEGRAEQPAGSAPPSKAGGRYRSSPRAVGALCLPVLGFWVPLLGPLISLFFALDAVPRAGARLWALGGRRRWGVPLLGLGAMWLPAVLAFSGASSSAFGADGGYLLGSTAWLLLPLCAPDQILVPTVVATAVYAAGAALSGALRRPWPWVLGAFLSALSYDLVILVLSVGSSC